MKFNIEVDCTPEELRRTLGLPDLTAVHDVYLDRLKDMMGKGITPDLVDQMVRTWVPGSGAGLDMMRDMISGFSGGGAGKSRK